MEEDLKKLVFEILSLTLLLIIVVPICVSASSNYQLKKEQYIQGGHTSVDISNQGDIKKVTVYSNADRSIKVSLILKISKFSNDYLVYLDDQIFNLRDLEYTEDLENQYYNLGFYEIKDSRVFDFQLKVKDKSYYDETISYSFFTEGLL